MMIIVYDDVRMDVNRIRLKMPYLADNNSKLLALKPRCLRHLIVANLVFGFVSRACRLVSFIVCDGYVGSSHPSHPLLLHHPLF
jgi:hypothetical protein